MYSKKQFTALEAMCREQAALARNEMELSLMKYWLAEAEEWKQLATAAADVVLARTVSAPPSGRHPPPSADLALGEIRHVDGPWQP
jgi:hypothetical protein